METNQRYGCDEVLPASGRVGNDDYWGVRKASVSNVNQRPPTVEEFIKRALVIKDKV